MSDGGPSRNLRALNFVNYPSLEKDISSAWILEENLNVFSLDANNLYKRKEQFLTFTFLTIPHLPLLPGRTRSWIHS